MLAELISTSHKLRAWKRQPDAPIREISLSSSETRDRPFTPAEVEQMKDFLRRAAPTGYAQIFDED
jgi:hypothetical protein